MRRMFAIGLVAAAVAYPSGVAAATGIDRHHRDRCRYEDCESGGGGNGASGGDYEGGKSGDQGDAGRDQCRNFCFYGIPMPPGGGQQPKASIGCLVPAPWHCDPPPRKR
jgi:hypothetical protein